jgi:hypothetical protein
MEMVNCALLNQEATRNYRMYQIWLSDRSIIDEIITILIEHAILAKVKERYQYEEWFAERGMFILNNLREIHMEHSGDKFIKLKIKIKKDYNDLYD